MKFKFPLLAFFGLTNFIFIHNLAGANDCTLSMVNNLAMCIKSKSNFLSEHKIPAAAAVVATGSYPAIVAMRKAYGEFLKGKSGNSIAMKAAKINVEWWVYLDGRNEGYPEKAFISYTEKIKTKMIDQLAKGLPLDNEWKINVIKDLGEIDSGSIIRTVNSKNIGPLMKDLKNPEMFVRSLIESVEIAGREVAASSGARGLLSIAGLARLATSKGAAAAIFGVSSVIGVGSIALDIGGDTPFDPKSCLDQRQANKGDLIPNLSSRLRVRDIINISFDRGCYPQEPEKKADHRVFTFLTLSDHDKEVALKEERVCKFYQELHSQYCEQTVVKLAKCDATRKELKIFFKEKEKIGQSGTVVFNEYGDIREFQSPSKYGIRMTAGDSFEVIARSGVAVYSWNSLSKSDSKVSETERKRASEFLANEGWDFSSHFDEIREMATKCSGQTRPRDETEAGPVNR